MEIGDGASFLSLLRDWHAAHRYGSARVDDFVTFTEQRFPQITDLPRFLQVWLYDAGQPTSW